MVSFAVVVPYMMSAFACNAVLAFHALLACAIVPCRSPSAEARPRMALVCRTLVMPSSSRITMALLPLRDVSFRPLMKEANAPAASVPQAFLNSEALMPATCAKPSRPSPVSTAL